MADLSFYTFSMGLGSVLIADKFETVYSLHFLSLSIIPWYWWMCSGLLFCLKKPKHLRHWHWKTGWALSALVILWFHHSFDTFSISSTRCNKTAPQHDRASTRFYYKWAFSHPSGLYFITYKQTDALYSQRAPLWLQTVASNKSCCKISFAFLCLSFNSSVLLGLHTWNRSWF